MTDALEEMGFPPALATGRQLLGFADPVEVLAERPFAIAGEGRVELWASTQEEPDPYSSVGFLLAVLSSPLERESTAAASALWRLLDNGRRRLRDDRFAFLAMEREEGAVAPLPWTEGARRLFARRAARLGEARQPRLSLRNTVEARLRAALRSPDPVTVSLAAAAGLPTAPLPPEALGAGQAESVGGLKIPKTQLVSTMVHGTWGWKGSWWRPRGGFHDFVLGNLRPNLYARGARFSWSGFYRESHRVQACTDFCEWGEEIAPKGLQSVFGHSYGGEVAARAVVEGTSVQELVLLSTPVTERVLAAVETGVPVVDVRLYFDPVLALTRTRQRLPARANVTTVRLKRWNLDHSATHKERVWMKEEIAKRAGM